jgi:uncharacterized membrane protein YbhN (UPF0104 family)
MFILYSFNQFTNISEYLFIFFLSAIATALPITVGGVGAREMAFVLLANVFHLDKELAVALSVMFYILSAISSLGGIYWVFFPPFRRENLPDAQLTFAEP